ncbi:MAG: hypothetical protein WB543_03505 [Candidatus Acidiferrum sp.]
MTYISSGPLVLRILLFLLAFAPAASSGAAAPVDDVDLGYLTMNHINVPWPSPESLLENLRAKDYAIRGKALSLVGVPQTTEAASSEPPQDTELRYADLGRDGTQQAVIGVRRDAMLYGAVAVQVGSRWHRIAAFSCWCKYESGDLLAGFIQIQPGPDGGEELVLRASGGGTGVYSQEQAHFRYRRGVLLLVFAFVSRHRECDPTKLGPYSCEVQRRWFYVHYWGTVAGAVLVESRLTLFPDADPEAELSSVPELELAHARKFSCRTYEWDKEKFHYEPFVAPNTCPPRTATK